MPSRYRTFQASSSPPEQVVESLTIIDPEEWDELHDEIWARSQPTTENRNWIYNKHTSGRNALKFQETGGPNGGKCVRVGVSNYYKGTNATWSGSTVTLDGSPYLGFINTVDGYPGAPRTEIIIDTSDSGPTSYGVTAYDDGANTVTLTATPSGTSGRSWWFKGGGLFNLWIYRNRATSGSLITGDSCTFSGATVTLDGSPPLSSATNKIFSMLVFAEGQEIGWEDWNIEAVDDIAKTITVATGGASNTPAVYPYGSQDRPWRICTGTVNNLGSGTDKYFHNGDYPGWNGLEVYVKFPTGYRATAASQSPSTSGRNWHIGTYHAVLEETTPESNGWHFYYEPWLRHDTAGDGWIRLVVRECHTNMRNRPGRIANNLTVFYGDTWDLATRFYLNSIAYYDDPEIDTPFFMYLGPVRLLKFPDTITMSIAWDSFTDGDVLELSQGQSQQLPFTITNSSGQNQNAKVHACGHGDWSPEVYVDGNLVDGLVEFPPGNTAGYYEVTRASHPNRPKSYGGVWLIPESQLTTDDANGKWPNWTDSNVENRHVEHSQAPLDAEMTGLVVHLNLV